MKLFLLIFNIYYDIIHIKLMGCILLSNISDTRYLIRRASELKLWILRIFYAK